MKRTALATGGNRGIGLAAARQLAEKGYAVFIGSRDPRDDASVSLETKALNQEVENDCGDVR